MSRYSDPFSARAEAITRRAILRADVHGMAHYGPAPAPLDETRDMIQEAVEELQEKLEDLREKIGSDPRRCIAPAGRRSARRVAEKGKRHAGDPELKSGPGTAPQRGGTAPRTGKASRRVPGAKSGPITTPEGSGTALDHSIPPRGQGNNGRSEEAAAGSVTSPQ